MFSFSHVKARHNQECGGKVCRNTKGSASCFSHVKAKQVWPKQAAIAKWQKKQWIKKGKISARQRFSRSKKQVQRSVPWVSRIEGLTFCEAPRYRFIGRDAAVGAAGHACTWCSCTGACSCANVATAETHRACEHKSRAAFPTHKQTARLPFLFHGASINRSVFTVLTARFPAPCRHARMRQGGQHA